MNAFIASTLLLHCALCLESGSDATEDTVCPTLLFASELEAARAAADSYNPRSIREDREYVGAIYEENGQFGFTVNAGGRRRDSWQFTVAGEDWERVRAIWHTHGNAASHHRYFSNVDTATAERLNIPFYLADYTGYLKVFRSGDRTLSRLAASRLGLPRQSGYAIGTFLRDDLGRPIRIKVRES